MMTVALKLGALAFDLSAALARAGAGAGPPDERERERSRKRERAALKRQAGAEAEEAAATATALTAPGRVPALVRTLGFTLHGPSLMLGPWFSLDAYERLALAPHFPFVRAPLAISAHHLCILFCAFFAFAFEGQ